MGDLSYDRKYRPKNINEYIGTDIKTRIMARFKDEKNMPNTLLLHGERGCGKTSLARLLAKEYLCLERVNSWMKGL